MQGQKKSSISVARRQQFASRWHLLQIVRQPGASFWPKIDGIHSARHRGYKDSFPKPLSQTAETTYNSS
jgi:hypothetical protein